MYRSRFVKGLCMVICLIVAMSLLTTGCGNTTTTTKGETSVNASSASTEQQSTAQALAPVNLKWYIDGTPQKDTDLVLTEVNKLLQKKMNATLDMVYIDWGSYDDKMKVLIAAGDSFDLCFTAPWANNINQNISKKAFMPMNDLLDNYGKDIKAFIPDSYWSAVSKDGKIYAVPADLAYSAGVPDGLVFKKEMVDKYKFDVNNVKKLQDIEPFLKSMKDNEKDMYPLYSNSLTNIPQFFGLEAADKYVAVQEPFYYDTTTNKVVNRYATPEMLEGTKLLNDWFKKGFIRKDATTLKDDMGEYRSGKYGAMSGVFIIDGGEVKTQDFQYPCVSIPLSKRVVDTAAIQNLCNAIGANSKNPERAMMLLNTMFQKDEDSKSIYNMLSFGLKDKHYKMDAENNMEFIDKSGYDAKLAWEIGPVFNKYYTKVENAQFVDKIYGAAKGGVISPLLGFVFNQEPVKTEMATVLAIKNEFDPNSASPLKCGLISSEALSKYNDKIKKSGEDKIIAEMEKQISDWKKANGK